MISLNIVIIILFAHWVSDFVMQTDEQAKGKSTSNKWLLDHILSYSTMMLVLCSVIPITTSAKGLVVWVAWNSLAHFMVDYVTSRVSSKLYKNGDIHNFFVVVGFDQFAHVAILISSYKLIF